MWTKLPIRIDERNHRDRNGKIMRGELRYAVEQGFAFTIKHLELRQRS